MSKQIILKPDLRSIRNESFCPISGKCSTVRRLKIAARFEQVPVYTLLDKALEFYYSYTDVPSRDGYDTENLLTMIEEHEKSNQLRPGEASISDK